VKENNPLFSDEEIIKNLTSLIDLSLGMTPNVSFIGVLPVNEALLNPIPWTPDKAYVNTSIKRIEDIIGAICASYKLPFYPLFQRWIEMKDYTDFFIDGIHPNSKGHALLAEQLKIFLLTEDFFKIHSPVR
jgi:lysophospholipase L1-like esterase